MIIIIIHDNNHNNNNNNNNSPSASEAAEAEAEEAELREVWASGQSSQQWAGAYSSRRVESTATARVMPLQGSKVIRRHAAGPFLPQLAWQCRQRIFDPSEVLVPCFLRSARPRAQHVRHGSCGRCEARWLLTSQATRPRTFSS